MSNLIEEVKVTVEEVIKEEELISEINHTKIANVALILRNLAVAIAMIVFLVSIFVPSVRHTLKSIAYFIGAAAYFCEFMLVTDFFKFDVPHRELFMIYCFGPLYLIMGISYIFI